MRNDPNAPPEDRQQKKIAKKANKRQLQLDAMKKKADDEDRYFRQCQKEAAKSQNRPSLPTEEELFGKQGAQGINFGKYNDIKVEVRRADGAKSPGFDNFDSLSLDARLRSNVTRMNYSAPTPIQKHSIPLALDGDDLMCCAQTGSGKTCAFLLPVVSKLIADTRAPGKPNGNAPATPRCVVMAPTRELAIQIELEAQKLCFSIPVVRTVTVYGGANPRSQLKALAYGGDDICVATPGRLTDFVDRNIVSLAQVQFLILDEADRMLDMGFEPQIRKLVLQSGMVAKEKRQTLLFSATFEASIQKLAATFLRADYTWIAVGRVGSTTDSITQVLVQAANEKRKKLQAVVKAIEEGPSGRTLIFVQKKRTATWLKKQLSKGGPDDGKEDERFTPIQAEDIHGDRSQSQREAALAKFRAGTCRVLVATDVAARGLDIAGVEHVINMDLPTAADDFDSYIHRIGRTGRAGHTGLATSLFVPVDNGPIVTVLVRQLKEAKQVVPEWLEALVAGGGGNRSGGGGRGAIGSDVRRSGGRGGRSGGRGGGSSAGRGGGRFGGRGGRGGGRSNGQGRGAN
jgi:ATP-dependent RNA helicase DDX3X